MISEKCKTIGIHMILTVPHLLCSMEEVVVSGNLFISDVQSMLLKVELQAEEECYQQALNSF